MLRELENQLIGCWKGALCGLLVHEDDCIQLDRATAQVIAKFNKLNFNQRRLKVNIIIVVVRPSVTCDPEGDKN